MEIDRKILEQKSKLTPGLKIHVSVPYIKLDQCSAFVEQKRVTIEESNLMELAGHHAEYKIVFSFKKMDQWCKKHGITHYFDDLRQQVDFYLSCDNAN
ncbi:hypothetical protein [Aquimarina algiphila]|uniref:hypothetical protein n=1 Tax=Aquimarina algiphila TaxID=2047982 RepID=UPI0023310528|nr:hypothetical protein [Aquimarina algiphila]